MRPEPLRPEALPETRRAPRRAVLGAALLLAGLVGGALLGGLDIIGTPGATDGLSDEQAARRQAEFTAAGPLALTAVPAADTAAAIEVMRLPPDQAAAMRSALDARTLRLAYLTLWDDMAEDGDAVRVSAAGFVQDVPLRNTPVRLAVPLADPAAVTLTGLHDGQGGITVAMLSGTTRVPLPRLRAGQVVPLPLR